MTIIASAFILIGGKSKRFGSPKWKAHFNGKPILDNIWNACDSFENRFVIGKEKPNGIMKPFVQDELEINAPINGLYTALRHSTSDWILLVSCDLPLLEPRVFENLWSAKSNKCKAIVPIANEKTQVTCGYYNKQILPTVENEINKQNYSIMKLLEKISVSFVEFGDDNRFINMNTPNDYNKLLSLNH